MSRKGGDLRASRSSSTQERETLKVLPVHVAEDQSKRRWRCMQLQQLLMLSAVAWAGGLAHEPCLTQWESRPMEMQLKQPAELEGLVR